MPDTIEGEIQDTTPVSTPETPNKVEGATDTAISQTPTDPQTPPAAASESKEPVVVDPPKASDSKTAVEFLTKGIEKPKTVDDKPKADKAPEAPKPKAEDPKEPAKPEPKAKIDEDPLSDYTEDDRKRLSHRTRDRIQELHRNWKQTETKYREAEPFVEQGKAFAEVLDEYQVRRDLPDLGENGDAAIAGAIKFQAATNRIMSGKGTAQDKAVAEVVFKSLDDVRTSIGLAPANPVDPTELEAAIASARDDFDYSKLNALVEKLKAKPAAAPKPVAPTAVAVPEQPRQPEAPKQDADLELYNGLLLSELEAAKVSATDAPKYVQEKLWPAVVTDLKTRFPSRDPVGLYNSLSAKAQYDLMARAHGKVQESLRQQAPAPKPSTPATPKPVATTGTSAIGTPPATGGVKAAIQFLTQG